MSRSEMKTLAKRQMKGRWGSAILIILLSGIIGGAAGLIGSILGPLEILVVMVVNAPMTLGAAMFYLHVIRGEEAGVGDLFQGFSDFKRSFALMFLRSVYLFLWTLLLVIPGIIKSYSYAMSFYVLQDNPEMSASEAMNRSRELMKGHRMELFVLQFSFFGWFLLGTITLGLANFYSIPYMQAAIAVFYENLAGNNRDYGATEYNTEYRAEYTSAAVADNTQAELPYQQFSGATEVLGSGSAPTTVLNQNQIPNQTEGTFTGVQGSLTGVAYTLDDCVEYAVGRDEELCGILADRDNTSISRMHCTIQFVSAQNGYYVTDQSFNGTFADGVRLPKGEPQFVHRGTVITLGDQREGFRLD